MPLPRVITFDIFSALIDSRSGGGAALDELAARRSWPVSGADVYTRWDAINKESQRTCRSTLTAVPRKVGQNRFSCTEPPGA